VCVLLLIVQKLFSTNCESFSPFFVQYVGWLDNLRRCCIDENFVRNIENYFSEFRKILDHSAVDKESALVFGTDITMFLE
jgi:hypothetical protein